MSAAHFTGGAAAPPQCGAEVLIRNSTSFPVQVSARLRDLFKEYQAMLTARQEGESQDPEHLAAAGLKYYQFLVRAVMTNPEFGVGECGNARGLLIYHTMGMGKTFLAVATAMALWDVRAPLVIVAKALQKNFIHTIEKFVRMIHPELSGDALKAKQAAAVRRFKFVSIDAYNMASQVAKATTGSEGSGTLNNRLLIVDEAHNLFRGIINSPSEKTNARRLYEMVMEARNLRILFLTGTPASKDPFELVPCFNMLAGYDILPTQYEVFYKHYVDKAGATIRNRGKLANRLLGLVSHVTHTLPSDPSKAATAEETGGMKLQSLRTDGGFPEEIETVIERVEMSAEQYRQYLLAREKEEAEGTSGEGGFAPSAHSELRIANSPALSLPGSEAGAGSTYYVKSRSLSNFTPPRDERDRAVDTMADDAFNEETSPKATRLVANLAKSPGPALIYSQFVDVGGLAVIARFLRNAGYKEYVLPPPAPSRAAEKAGGLADFIIETGGGFEEVTPPQSNPRRVKDLLAALPPDSLPPAEIVEAVAIAARGPQPVSPWVDEAPPAPDGIAYSSCRRVRLDKLVNLHRGQRKLALSEVLAYTHFLSRADDGAVVVYAGAAPGHHLPFLAELYPAAEFHLYDPAPFRFRAGPGLQARMRTYSEYFTDEVARRWTGKCDIFVCDIRVAREDRKEFEDQVAVDMAAQDRWTRIISPRLGAVLKFRPPYVDETDAPRADGCFEYVRGRVMWQGWAPTMSTEGRLIVDAADATPDAPPARYDALAHQNTFYYHNALVRPWQELDPPAEGLSGVPGYDGCFDCALEAWAWVHYLGLPGAQGSGVAGMMRALTAATRQSLVAKTPPPYHGVSPLAARMEKALRARAARGAAEAPPRYAIISGDVKPEDRIRIQEVFNSPQNAHGELIRALLVSKTGAEGLDLKGVRQVHIFEPYWDKSREDQVKARGVRLGSHDHLPVEEREVQPFLYIAVANQEMFEGMRPTEREKEAPPSRYRLIEEITIDEKFHTRALVKHAINGSFRELLRDVCLECSINGYGDCRLCVPTDAPLFHEDPIRDLRLPDPCQPLTESELSVKEIGLPAEDGDGTTTYFYSEDPTAPFGVRFFVYDEELEAHSPVDPSSGLFMRLLEALRG
jgi:superfamily II DNA or RNA helicase